MILNTDEVFEVDPNDPDNVLLKIPPEICESLGWKEGDMLNIEVNDGTIHISKKHG